MYEVVMEEAFGLRTGGRAYYSETVIRTMLTELDAKLIAAEYNTTRRGDVYYFVRETAGPIFDAFVHTECN